MNAAQRSASASTSERPLSEAMLSQLRSGQLRSGQPRSGQSRSGQSRSSQRLSRQLPVKLPVTTLPVVRSPYQPKRVPYAGARRAIALESSVKLTINLLLAIVATTTIAKLVPYYQSQQTRLASLEESVAVAERKNVKLRQEFDRNFDPAQSSRIMQEQSGMGHPNQKKVIWAKPPAVESPAAVQ